MDSVKINVQVCATDKNTTSASAGTTPRSSQTTQRQYATLLMHMETHPQMRKISKGSWTQADKDKSWELLAKTLNEDCGKGAVKTPKKWRKTFSDWKNTVKNKVKNMQLQPEGSSTKAPLTDLEKRLVKMMGWENLAQQQALANGLPGTSSSEPQIFPSPNNLVNGSAESTELQQPVTSQPDISQVTGGDNELNQIKTFLGIEINESGQQNEIPKMEIEEENYELYSEDENYEPEFQDTNFESEFQDENFESDYQDENFESDYQDKNSEPNHKDGNYESYSQDENYESDSLDENYDPDHQNGNYVPPDQSRPSTLSQWEPCNYVPPNQNMARRLDLQNGNSVPGRKNGNYVPEHQDENNESDNEVENASFRKSKTQADIPTFQGETTRKRKRSSEDDRDDEISSVSLLKMFMESVTSMQTLLVKLVDNQNQQAGRILNEVKGCRRSLRKIADKF